MRCVRKMLRGALAALALMLLGSAAFAQIALVGSASQPVTGGAISSAQIAKPAGLTAGDVMLAWIGQGGSYPSLVKTAPSGWSKLGELRNGSNLTVAYYWKLATATEPGTYQFEFNQSDRAMGVIAAFRGADPSAPINASAIATSAASASATALIPSVTTSVGGALLVGAFVAANGNVSIAPQASMRALAAAASGAGPNGVAFEIASETLGAPGASGGRSATVSGAQLSIGMSVALKASSALAGFQVTPASLSGSTCAPLSVTVKALSAAGGTLTSFTGTISLSTSVGSGNWSLSGGAGSFSAGAADSGLASYTFSAADAGVAVFNLAQQRATSLTVSASSSAPAGAGVSSSITYSDSAMVVSSIDALGAEVVAGRPQAMLAQLWRKDPASGVCALASAYNGSKQLDGWAQPSAMQPAGALAPGISTSSNCSGAIGLPTTAPAISASSNNVTLSFASGSANFWVCAMDVGQWSVGLQDDSGQFNKAPVSGLSALMTARPFALRIDQIQSAGGAPNPGGSASAGSAFVAAEESFKARVSGVLWASGQDTASPGQPDASADLSANSIAPSFAASVALTAGSVSPAGGVVGSISPAIVSAASFGGGAATLSLSYSEAGAMALSASASNYLGSAVSIPAKPSALIGRFKAAKLTLDAAAVSPACAAGGFTYMSQPEMGIQAIVSARGAAGGVLKNYDQARGNNYTAPLAWVAVNNADGVDRSARLSGIPATVFANGVWSVSASAASFDRLASGPDGSFEKMAIGLKGADADGAAIETLDLSSTAAGSCAGAGCDSRKIGEAKLIYGKLGIDSSVGALLPTLRVGLKALRWDNGGWRLNTLDSCTALPAGSFAAGGFQGAISSMSATSATISAGSGVTLVTRSPSGASAAKAILSLNLGAGASPSSCSPMPAATPAGKPWLRESWCQAGAQQDPYALIVWGSPGAAGGQGQVFSRERY